MIIPLSAGGSLRHWPPGTNSSNVRAVFFAPPLAQPAAFSHSGLRLQQNPQGKHRSGRSLRGDTQVRLEWKYAAGPLRAVHPPRAAWQVFAEQAAGKQDGGVTVSTGSFAARRHAGVWAPVIARKTKVANDNLALAA